MTVNDFVARGRGWVVAVIDRGRRYVAPPGLTTDQQRLLGDLRTSAGAGANRTDRVAEESTRHAIDGLYNALGLRPPLCVIQLSSPMACQLALAALAEPMPASIRRLVRTSIIETCGQTRGAVIWAALEPHCAGNSGIAGAADWSRLRISQSDAPLHAVLQATLQHFSRRAVRAIFGTSRALAMLRPEPTPVAVHIDAQLVGDPQIQFPPTEWQDLWSRQLRVGAWEPFWRRFGDDLLADVLPAPNAGERSAIGAAIWRGIAQNSAIDMLTGRHGWRRLYRPTPFQGAMDTGWLAACQFARDEGVRLSRTARDYIAAYGNYTENAGWAWLYRDIALVSDRPEQIVVDAQGRPHNPDGPAVRFRDGWSTHAWKGLEIASWMIREPERITLSTIEREPGVEVRRALIERVGAERYIRMGGARLASEDDTGKLWKRRGWGDGDTAFEWAAVEVVNGSPEPDGSFRHYYLQVPPEVRSAREAVAWTYGLSAGEYSRLIRRT